MPGGVGGARASLASTRFDGRREATPDQSAQPRGQGRLPPTLQSTQVTGECFRHPARNGADDPNGDVPLLAAGPNQRRCGRSSSPHEDALGRQAKPARTLAVKSRTSRSAA